MKNFSPESLHTEAMAKIDSLKDKLNMGDFCELKDFIDHLCRRYKAQFYYMRGLLEDLSVDNEKLKIELDDKIERLDSYFLQC
jgi:hypothetical protein